MILRQTPLHNLIARCLAGVRRLRACLSLAACEDVLFRVHFRFVSPGTRALTISQIINGSPKAGATTHIRKPDCRFRDDIYAHRVEWGDNYRTRSPDLNSISAKRSLMLMNLQVGSMQM